MESKKSLQGARVEAGILLGWAAFFIFVLFSGRLPHYINPKFVAVPIVGALIAIAMVLASRKRGHSGDSCGEVRDLHLLIWFLMPVVLGLLIAPQGLDMRNLGGLSSGTANSGVFLNLAESAKYKTFTVAELANAGHIKRGKVSVEGQVRSDAPGLHPGEYALAHYQMTCCVADLRQVWVIMKCPNFRPEDGQWIRVQGIAERDKSGVLLTADTVTPIAEPNPPYIY